MLWIRKRLSNQRGSVLLTVLVAAVVAAMVVGAMSKFQINQIRTQQAVQTDMLSNALAEYKWTELKQKTVDTVAPEVRAAVPGYNLEREVTVTLDADGKSKDVAVNIYRPGDSVPYFTLPLLLPYQGNNGVPSGTVLAWYGNLSAIPNGFVYCDGSNGTPDLRGRTIVGTGSWSDNFGSINYVSGSYGGERMHKLTVAEMPSHNHTFQMMYQTGGNWSWPSNGPGNSLVHWPTDYTGGDQPHNIMNPYCSLHWIMKL